MTFSYYFSHNREKITKNVHIIFVIFLLVFFISGCFDINCFSFSCLFRYETKCWPGSFSFACSLLVSVLETPKPGYLTAELANLCVPAKRKRDSYT